MPKTFATKVRKRRVCFKLEAPHKQQVALVGNFNAWNPEKHPMKKTAGGRWEKIVVLKPGIYEYKFHADGQWIADPANTHQRPNCYGTRNSVVVVEA